MRLISCLLAAVWLNFPTPADACTVFVLNHGSRYYYGSNFDWHRGSGYVIVNPRGKKKDGWRLPEDPGLPVQWQSEFGSVTFVQYGQGLPKGGMNEAGLVIESLLLPGSEYPTPDDRPYIGSTSQLNQYLLDTCATVADVVARLSRIRPATYDWAPGVHFMAADAGGDCAVIEFIRGEMKIFRGGQLPYKVLTNQPYSRPHATPDAPADADMDFSYPAGGRIHTVAMRLKQYRATVSGDAVAYAMETLNQVSAGEFTQWQVVYDQHARVAHWRCGPDETVRRLDLKKIDFSCERPTAALPVKRLLAGDVNRHLTAFGVQDNRDLVYQAVAGNQHVIPLPHTIRETMWQMPQKEICLPD